MCLDWPLRFLILDNKNRFVNYCCAISDLVIAYNAGNNQGLFRHSSRKIYLSVIHLFFLEVVFVENLLAQLLDERIGTAVTVLNF